MAEESKLAEKLEEKQSEASFTEEEMNQLGQIKERYLDIQHQFGQAAIVKIRLENRIEELNTSVESLKKDYITNQKTEEEFVKTINEKYGDGELNPETGVFTPFSK